MDCMKDGLVEILLAQSQKQTTVDLGFLDEHGDITSNRERKGHGLSGPYAKGSGQIGRELGRGPELWVCREVLEFDRSEV